MPAEPVESFVIGRLNATAKGNLAALSGAITSTITSPTGQVMNFVNGVLVNTCGNGVGSTSPVNPDYFSNITAQIEKIGDLGAAEVAGACAALQEQVDNTFSGLQAQINDLNAQLAALAPILALLSAPGNPTAVITWITNFIEGFLTPYVIPYTTMAAQLISLGSQITSLTSAVESAEAKIPGCSIIIPTITGL